MSICTSDGKPFVADNSVLSGGKGTNFANLEADIDDKIKHLDYLSSRNALSPTDVLQLIKDIRAVETMRRMGAEGKLSAAPMW